MFHIFTSDQQFFELVISNDDNNSPKESKVSNDNDTVSKSAQNSLP